jgi:hypothetical protein
MVIVNSQLLVKIGEKGGIFYSPAYGEWKIVKKMD